MKSENNENCKIVQDLMPSYLENLLSEESENFVNNHISTCDNCKKYLSLISENIANDKENENKEDDISIDYLKKYRKKMLILKTILLIILIVIAVILISIFAKYKYNQQILNNAMKKIEEINLCDNFYISRKTIYIDYINNDNSNQYIDKIYYKNGKYKQDSGYCITYGEEDSNKLLKVFEEQKIIENVEANYVPYRKRDLISLCADYSFGIVNKSFSENLGFLNSVIIDEAKYGNINCYVVRTSISDDGYYEYWINKDTNLMIRRVNESYGRYYREEIFTVTLNQTLDEDVEIDNLEQYSDYTHKNVTVTDNVVKEWREKYN